jgi:hypothetical protein
MAVDKYEVEVFEDIVALSGEVTMMGCVGAPASGTRSGEAIGFCQAVPGSKR